MVNVTKDPLNKKLEQKLFVQFSALIAKANVKTSSTVVEGLLTEAEHMMLAKRFAIILMIHEGCPKRMIARVLKVSRTTVQRIEDECTRGEHRVLLRVVGKYAEKERQEMWETIEVVLRLGMPPMGKDRWKWLDKHMGRNYPKHK